MKYRELNENELKSVKKKFGMITEYSFITNRDDMLLDEDDEDPNNNLPVLDQTQDAVTPTEPAMIDPASSAPADPSMDLQPEQPIEGPQAPDPMEMPPMDTAPIETPEVEVDVTQLTQDQKQVDDKVSSLADQTSQMMELLASITDKVDGITSKIDSDTEAIRQEIEKRNPTPKEVLQKRQTLGDPFNQTPEDFWNQKEEEGQYELSDDKNLEIKPSDLDDNAMNVYKSFGIKDNEVNQSLKGVMGY